VVVQLSDFPNNTNPFVGSLKTHLVATRDFENEQTTSKQRAVKPAEQPMVDVFYSLSC
jgi:hypothetical protein